MKRIQGKRDSIGTVDPDITPEIVMYDVLPSRGERATSHRYTPYPRQHTRVSQVRTYTMILETTLIQKACKRCRKKKIRCDEKAPCTSCAVAGDFCEYSESVISRYVVTKVLRSGH